MMAMTKIDTVEIKNDIDQLERSFVELGRAIEYQSMTDFFFTAMLKPIKKEMRAFYQQ